MPIKIGQVEAIFRYPGKSMSGERLEAANLGWHGIDGDRRLAFRRLDYRGGGCPWLSASHLPDLLLFAPRRREDDAQGDLPTHVRTPDGEQMPVLGEDLACLELSSLRNLLLGAYRVRDKFIAEHREGVALAKVERDLILVHELITRHQAFCPDCTLQES